MSSSVSANVSLVQWFCDRCGDMYEETHFAEYPMNEGERVPSACDMDCYPDSGRFVEDYGELCDDCCDQVIEAIDGDEVFSSNPERLLAMKKIQREVINGHLENLVKIAEVTS